MNAFQTGLNEILLISSIPNRNVEVATIGRGEGHKPVSALTDKFYKELVIHIYFLQVDLSTKLKEKYLGRRQIFNQRLVNHTQNLDQTWITFFLRILFRTNLVSINNQVIKIVMRKEMQTS